ncbi:MAG: nicotinate-nucleotide--dimethylbenzimidazole phosphoribosyltransferase [Bryobacterales bacterium]
MAGFLHRVRSAQSPSGGRRIHRDECRARGGSRRPRCSHLAFGHRSAEPGHALLLNALGAGPLLELEMRLGEGTGAALGMGVVDAAVALYREMATFESAGISA